MRIVTVQGQSFPKAAAQVALQAEDCMVWQVLCGDSDHWRAGLYSPELCTHGQIVELEQHTCPELFVLLSGRISLVVADPALRVIELQRHRGVLVTAPHNGFCPDGPHSGVALVIERDQFQTTYKTVADWVGQ